MTCANVATRTMKISFTALTTLKGRLACAGHLGTPARLRAEIWPHCKLVVAIGAI